MDHAHGGHSHGSHFGISGVLLHVAGDAINSELLRGGLAKADIGVVIAALIMWLAPWESRYYADPGVSVAIGLIIFAGALPLSTSNFLFMLTCASCGTIAARGGAKRHGPGRHPSRTRRCENARVEMLIERFPGSTRYTVCTSGS
jgi:hypothetical protein